MAYVFLPSIDKHMYPDVDDEESKDFFSRFESGRLMPGFFPFAEGELSYNDMEKIIAYNLSLRNNPTFVKSDDTTKSTAETQPFIKLKWSGVDGDSSDYDIYFSEDKKLLPLEKSFRNKVLKNKLADEYPDIWRFVADNKMMAEVITDYWYSLIIIYYRCYCGYISETEFLRETCSRHDDILLVIAKLLGSSKTYSNASNLFKCLIPRFRR